MCKYGRLGDDSVQYHLTPLHNLKQPMTTLIKAVKKWSTFKSIMEEIFAQYPIKKKDFFIRKPFKWLQKGTLLRKWILHMENTQWHMC